MRDNLRIPPTSSKRVLVKSNIFIKLNGFYYKKKIILKFM